MHGSNSISCGLLLFAGERSSNGLRFVLFLGHSHRLVVGLGLRFVFFVGQSERLVVCLGLRLSLLVGKSDRLGVSLRDRVGLRWWTSTVLVGLLLPRMRREAPGSNEKNLKV